MERFFRLKEHGTNVRTEIMAGLTTFMTMAYILAVNPIILTPAGLNWTAVFLATALAAGIFTIAMGLFVNFPVALAPGMGLNAYFASVIIASAATDTPITPAMGLTAVFISGLIFIILTLTQIRQMLITAVPDSLKHAITVGIGLFIAIIGLKNSGLMTIAVSSFTDIKAGAFTPVSGPETVIQLGSFHSETVVFTIIALLLIAVLMVLRVPGAILFGILGTTVIAILSGHVDVSKTLSGQTWIPNFKTMNVWHFDFAGVFEVGLVTVILTFTFVELFDTFGTLVGTANRAGYMKNPEEGKKRIGKAMFVDAIGVGGGAVLGTSTVTAYVESSAGIAQGGRTGLTAVTTGICFLLAIFLSPLVALVPGSATAAALIIVGVLMMQSVKEIDFTDMVYAIPSFFTLALMPFTYNIANGISFGIVTYVLLATVANLSGKGKYKVHWLMWILAVLIIGRYVFMGGE
ncbi:NCS2 family permease [Paenibacillus prosopidis]|uniref:AGZA family xanthine/uracil permease-like MFS transporter n=1 Tax=Paenibacillus prosopidis TaxID=630520 RepID=A0A368W8A3_9BACL|nr:NCS2 family permease [Paenibacillus prosopidis]RCW51865.1 AGZA family xanthine/uracil permease-like MFS transporter [Paenibacillus prosopidis]